MAASATKASALDLFNSLTLEAVREQIAEVDGEIAVLEKKRDSLRTIEKAIDIRDNGRVKKTWSRKPKKAADSDTVTVVTDTDTDDSDAAATQRPDASAGRKPSPETVALRDRLHKILRLHGPMKIGDLSRDAKIEYGTVSNALTGPQFRKLDDGRYTIK